MTGSKTSRSATRKAAAVRPTLKLTEEEKLKTAIQKYVHSITFTILMPVFGISDISSFLRSRLNFKDRSKAPTEWGPWVITKYGCLACDKILRPRSLRQHKEIAHEGRRIRCKEAGCVAKLKQIGHIGRHYLDRHPKIGKDQRKKYETFFKYETPDWAPKGTFYHFSIST